MNSMMLILAVVCAVLGTSPVVHLPNGDLRGLGTRTYNAFRGIPYATPPVGARRWRSPQPAASWRPSTLDARTFKPNCVQTGDFDPPMPVSFQDEDCLYLNVYVPANATSTTRLPVMFWVHGGGYQGGGSAEARLNGTWNAAENDVVVVTINYRLNVFGFLAADALRARNDDGSTGNYGIQDQRLALRWVQDNIEFFGGDATRVLLVGESAGGASVINHLVRRQSWGLYQRALVESGAYALLPGMQMPMAGAERNYNGLLNSTGCLSAPDQVACLTAVSADKLRGVLKKGGLAFRPTVDSVDLTHPISELVANGSMNARVPIIAGSVREDLGLLPRIQCKGDLCNEDDFKKMAEAFSKLNPLFPVDDMVKLYSGEANIPGGNYTKWHWAGVHANADVTMTCTARRLLKHAPHPDTHWFQFTHVPEGPSGAYPSLCHHACEIPFVFQVKSANESSMHIRPDEFALAASVVAYWRSFAATGSPNISSQPTWDTFTAATGNALELDIPLKAHSAFMQARCDFWDKNFYDVVHVDMHSR